MFASHKLHGCSSPVRGQHLQVQAQIILIVSILLFAHMMLLLLLLLLLLLDMLLVCLLRWERPGHSVEHAVLHQCHLHRSVVMLEHAVGLRMMMMMMILHAYAWNELAARALALLAVQAARALAPLCARHSKLETLAVALAASTLLTSASFAMRGHALVDLVQLLHESLRIALLDLIASLLDDFLLLVSVAAARARAVFAADDAAGKALAVELEAFAFEAGAFGCARCVLRLAQLCWDGQEKRGLALGEVHGHGQHHGMLLVVLILQLLMVIDYLHFLCSG